MICVSRKLQRTVGILGCIGLIGALDAAAAFADAEREEDTLLVWAGDQARVNPDFLAVVDFDRKSPAYGKVLRTVPLEGASAVGNEPHHVGVSSDGRTLALGALLSILKGQVRCSSSM
jgi:hypothetical protein